MNQVINTCVPFIFKHAVDTLNAANTLNLGSPETTVATMVTATLIGKFGFRVLLGTDFLYNSLFIELLNLRLYKPVSPESDEIC